MLNNFSLNDKYKEHQVFTEISEYAEFYDSLAFSVLSFITQGTKSVLNIDTYLYSSIQGTLESIKDILIKGKINDSYALLRKYYDSIIINIYCDLYLSDNSSIQNIIVEKIENWIKGDKQLPEYLVMIKYIKDSEKLSEINKLLDKDDRYRKIRNRCNDHMHYNFYHNVLLNDNKMYSEYRLKLLDVFYKDLENIFILHLSYLFYLNDHYMMSSDYIDYLELGLKPEEDSQYFVAPFVQDIFNKVLKKNRMDIVEEIKSKTAMKLE